MGGIYVWSFYPPYWDNKNVAYIVLYNKYQAKMRVFAILPDQGYSSASITKVQLAFTNPSTGSNGLLNQFNSLEQPLDQKTNVVSATAIALQPNGTNKWIYADFPMAYDPCTCFWQSAINVSFTSVTNGTLSATGRSLGIVTPASLLDVSGGSGINSFMGDNSPFDESYLTSYYAGDDHKAIDGLVQDYRSADALAQDLQNQGFDPGQYQKALKLMGDIAGGSGESADGASSVFGFISDWLDLYSSEAKSDAYPMVISSQLVLKGQIALERPENGSDFTFSTPGSLSADNSPEYSQMIAGNPPSYPMYNNPMGLFALLNTLHAQRAFADYDVGYAYDESNGWHFSGRWQYQYKLKDDPIKFALNPLVDAEKTSIMAALEVEGMPNDLPNTSYYTNLALNNLVYKDNGAAPDFKFRRYRTNFFPLSCINNVITNEQFQFNGPLDAYNATFSGKRHINIILSIAYVFKPDEYGNVHTSEQILKYPLEIDDICNNDNGCMLSNDSRFLQLAVVPTDLALHSKTYAEGATEYSYGNITIDGHLAVLNHFNHPVHIQAQGDIEVLPGARIDPNIILEPNVPYPTTFCKGEPLKPTIYSDGDCKGGAYQAFAGSKRGVETAPLAAPAKDFNATIYPNPAHDQFSVSIAGVTDKDVRVKVQTITGQVVYNERFEAAPEQGEFKAEVKGLNVASGTYMVTITNGTNTAVRKLSIVK